MTLEPAPADTPICLDPHNPRFRGPVPLAVVGQLGAGRTILVDEPWQLITPDPEALRVLLARARAGAARADQEPGS